MYMIKDAITLLNDAREANYKLSVKSARDYLRD